MECPICGGEGEALGLLGILQHLRCKNCGGTFTRIVEGEVVEHLRCKQCKGIMGHDEDPGDGRCYECHAGPQEREK